MILIREEDILHKAKMLRLLTGIVDNPVLSAGIYFKGGTCASMLGYLDRFSVDLDFDLKEESDKTKLRREFERLFKDLDFEIISRNDKTLFFTLKYNTPENQRNKLKLSVSDIFIKANDYKITYFPEIDRMVGCQTIETMFANKLVAPIDRFEKHEKVAGRDIYDICHFFSQGYKFKREIIKERTRKETGDYLKILIKFIEEKVTDTLLTEDLNTLLPYEKFRKIRKTLKGDTLIFLRSALGKFDSDVVK